jgi:hypothetical protein
MMTLSEALQCAETYKEQQYISTPAKAAIKLAEILKGILSEDVYESACKGEFDAKTIGKGEVSRRK